MKRIYNNICQCCKNEFETNSHNKKYCKNCEELIDNIEYKILPQEINENNIDILNNFNIEKFENNIGGVYFWININLKNYSENIKDDFIIKLFYYRCDNCNNYYHIDNLKGRVNKIINSIENNQTVTCSRKCQNQLKAKNGMNFICKYCGEEFFNKNPRIYSCNRCTLELDDLYENIFPKVIESKYFDKWIKDKNIVENFKNKNNGEYFIFNYKFKNKILNFIYKKCIVCNDLIRIDDHIDRFLNDIKNNNSMTFCSNNHQNQYLNKYRVENNLIKCTCKRCEKEFYSNNHNTNYCEDCNEILQDIYNEINYNENGGIYNDWFLNNENNIEIIEEFKNSNNSEYKIIIYKK